MQAYSRKDIFCAIHSMSMAVLPEDPKQEWERLECSRCDIPITKEAIINTFQEVEQLIEQELSVAILFFNGVLMVESTEYIGSKRRRS
jgi:hypothetical protein